MEINCQYGIPATVYLRRDRGRWCATLYAAPWLEDDLRLELVNRAFVLDLKSARTNGIDLVQAPRGD